MRHGRRGALYCIPLAEYDELQWKSWIFLTDEMLHLQRNDGVFPFLCCMSDYQRVLNKQYMYNICIYVVGAEDQMEWQSGTPLRTQH